MTGKAKRLLVPDRPDHVIEDGLLPSGSVLPVEDSESDTSVSRPRPTVTKSPRSHVMAAYETSHPDYAPLYKKLAE